LTNVTDMAFVYNNTAYNVTTVGSSFGVNGSANYSVNVTTPVVILDTTLINLSFSYNVLIDSVNISKNFTRQQIVNYSVPRINITVFSALSGVGVNNFSGYVYKSSNQTFYVTNGYSLVRLTDGVGNYSLYVNASNYAITNATNYRTLILNATTPITYNTSFNLYYTNSLNITFRNAKNNELLDDANISIYFIGYSASNFSTSNGTLYLSLFIPDYYTIVYSAPGYQVSKYSIDLPDNSYQALTLYLQNSSTSQLVLLTVKDKFGTPLSDVQVLIQSWTNNSWVTNQILTTDFQGRAEAYYVLSDIYYNHVLTYNSINYFGSINSNDDKKLIYAEDVTNGVVFNIDTLGGSNVLSYLEVLGNAVSLTFINTSGEAGYFRFAWINPNNQAVTGCLNVSYVDNNSVVCGSCSSTASGVLTCSVSSINETNVFSALVSIDDYVIGSFIRVVGSYSGQIDWGVTGYIVAFLLVSVAFLIFLSSPTMSLFVGSGIFVLLIGFGVLFRDMNYALFVVLLAITYLIASIKSSSGVNG